MDTPRRSTRPRSWWPPETRLGTWAAATAVLALGGTVALAVGFALGLEQADSFSDRPLLTLAGGAVLASGVASVVTGLLALVRRHDRSWLVVAATVVGAVVTVVITQQVVEGLGWSSA